MSGLTIRVKRGSRGSATLLEAANRILRLLGVSSTKRGKQPSPKSKVRSTTPKASAFMYPLVCLSAYQKFRFLFLKYSIYIINN